MKRAPTLDFRLLLITDRRLLPAGALAGQVEAICRAGVRAVQLREKDLTTRALLDTAVQLRQITTAYDTHLFVNDRIDVALCAGANGVHCPENGLPVDVARRLMGEGAKVGASVHSTDAAVAAAGAGADFVMFGPVFATPSKAQYGKPQGLGALEAVCQRVDVPVVAVGGIEPQTALLCLDTGASAVAAITALITAEDVDRVVGEFKLTLGGL